MKKTVLLLALPLMIVALLILGEGSRSPAAQPGFEEKLAGGPYVVNVGQRSATVMWLMQTGESSLGAEPGKTDKIAPALRAERIVFTGLKPGTRYYYQAFPGEAGKGSFKTAPREAEPFQFVVYGDVRTRHDVHRTVINAVLKYAQPDFVMHTGDLVADGPDTSLWPIFFDIERELLRNAAFFPALGNHERNARNYFDYLDARPFYSFDWGGVHFVVIDSDIENAGITQAAKDAFWQEQTRWLEADLRDAQDARFRFLFAHHPPMTAVKRRQGDNPQMTALEPMFEKYKLSAGFFGHDHNYQHYRKNGVHYFITGGGGAPLYDVDTPPQGITMKVVSIENFVMVDVSGEHVRVRARTPSGDTPDDTELVP